MGTAILTLDDGRGFNDMGMWNGRKNSFSSSCSSCRLGDEEGAARKKSSFPRLRLGTTGLMSTTSMEVSSAARLGGGGHEAITSTNWTEDGLGVVR